MINIDQKIVLNRVTAVNIFLGNWLTGSTAKIAMGAIKGNKYSARPEADICNKITPKIAKIASRDNDELNKIFRGERNKAQIAKMPEGKAKITRPQGYGLG